MGPPGHATARKVAGGGVAFLSPRPPAGRGRIASPDVIRVRGSLRESNCRGPRGEPPSPHPLPASGARESGQLILGLTTTPVPPPTRHFAVACGAPTC